ASRLEASAGKQFRPEWKWIWLGIEHRRSSPGASCGRSVEAKRLRGGGTVCGTRCEICSARCGAVVPAGLCRPASRAFSSFGRRLQSRTQAETEFDEWHGRVGADSGEDGPGGR